MTETPPPYGAQSEAMVCLHCGAPCQEHVLPRGGTHGWGDAKSRTVRRYAALAPAQEPARSGESVHWSHTPEFARRVLRTGAEAAPSPTVTLTTPTPQAAGVSDVNFNRAWTAFQVEHGSYKKPLSDEALKAGLVAALTAAGSAPEGFVLVRRSDLHLAGQMLHWGREEGLTQSQERDVDAHARKLIEIAASRTRG